MASGQLAAISNSDVCDAAETNNRPKWRCVGTSGVTDVGVGSWPSCGCRGKVKLPVVGEIWPISSAMVGDAMDMPEESPKVTTSRFYTVHSYSCESCTVTVAEKGLILSMAINLIMMRER
eukprot:scaffold10768_cov24-Cyclotella_meneghiniana.AAC.7